MAIKIGTRLGSYEISALLGAGGMGEVYRATDTKLRRDVAIKVLPEDVAGDSERLARFEREAHLLAAWVGLGSTPADSGGRQGTRWTAESGELSVSCDENRVPSVG